MERGYFSVAKSYIIYRYEHTKAREEKRAEVAEKIEDNQLLIVKRDGRKENFSEPKLTRTLMRAAEGYERLIDIPSIIGRVRQEMYEGIKSKEIHDVLIMVVRSMIERDPAHSYVASRLLLQYMYREVLGDILAALGMPTAFDAATADFSGMTTQTRLVISKVIHQANISVDEKGTEAAAVTVVGMDTTGGPSETCTAHADRPFLFALRDVETGAILFMGRVVDPSAN